MIAERRKRKGGPLPIGSILGNVLDATGISDRLRDRHILDDWAGVVGEAAAKHCRPVDFAAGVLTVDADHAAWRQELTLLTPMIIEKFNAIHGAGTIKSLRWSRLSTRRNPKDNDK